MFLEYDLNLTWQRSSVYPEVINTEEQKGFFG